MRLMLRWMAHWRRALGIGRRRLQTDWRRPLLVAVATGFAMLRVLPGGDPVVRVEVVDAGGAVEQVFSLAVGDPQLESLRRAADAASHPDYRKRSPDYYRAQWDVVAAEFYLAQAPPVAPVEVSGATGEAPRRAPGAIRQVSYATAAGTPAGEDWGIFWSELRASSLERMRSLEPAPRVDPMFGRMRFGAVARGPSPTSTVFLALCAAMLGLLASRRWACRAPQRLIGLRSSQQLEVPATWIRRRRCWRDLRSLLTRGRIVECAAAAALLVLAIG